MKFHLLIAFIISTPLLMAQENSNVTPPVIVAKVALGETVNFEETCITFLKVVEDSRCPSGVTCIWAGQAKVSVTIKTEKGTLEKELIFHGAAFGNESENTLFVSGSKKYIGHRLSPYPTSTEPANGRKYTLEIYIK